MKKIILPILLVLCLAVTACATAAPIPTDTPTPVPPTETVTPIPPTETPLPTDTATLPPSETPTETPTEIPSPTATFTATPTPVESLNATLATNLLSCRYGPGPNYLYLIAMKDGARLKLIGWTGGSNWALVKNDPYNCWVNVKFLNIEGDFKTLPVTYPDPILAPLPVSPYYGRTTVLSATRSGNKVNVVWLGVPVDKGNYEDENMFIYIVEVWRCEGGQIIFDPIASNIETVSFVDEPGCAQPSHGRVFVQEKHGYAGPAEIPWP